LTTLFTPLALPCREAFFRVGKLLCCGRSEPSTICRPPTVGIDIVRRAVEAPVRQIAENAGTEGSIIVGKLRGRADFSFGWNAQTGEYGDLYGQGVIDPAKVVRTALEDAASVAGLLITTEAMIAEKPKKDSAPTVPPGAGAGMDF